MLTVVIPMAGAGSRFTQKGYTLPKPFIDVAGRMMIDRVLEGVQFPDTRYLLVVQKKILDEYEEKFTFLKIRYGAEIITVQKLTQGAACTALATHKHLDQSEPVAFIDCDTVFSNTAFAEFIQHTKYRQIDGSLMTFFSASPKFSYVQTDSDGWIVRTKEKEVISENAIAGVYFFTRAEYFIDAAIEMLIYGDKAKNEFYMSNVYNYAVLQHKHIDIFKIETNQFACLGTPSQLEEYLKEKKS